MSTSKEVQFATILEQIVSTRLESCDPKMESGMSKAIKFLKLSKIGLAASRYESILIVLSNKVLKESSYCSLIGLDMYEGV